MWQEALINSGRDEEEGRGEGRREREGERGKGREEGERGKGREGRERGKGREGRGEREGERGKGREGGRREVRKMGKGGGGRSHVTYWHSQQLNNFFSVIDARQKFLILKMKLIVCFSHKSVLLL